MPIQLSWDREQTSSERSLNSVLLAATVCESCDAASEKLLQLTETVFPELELWLTGKHPGGVPEWSDVLSEQQTIQGCIEDSYRSIAHTQQIKQKYSYDSRLVRVSNKYIELCEQNLSLYKEALALCTNHVLGRSING